jgi:hypothetical protein
LHIALHAATSLSLLFLHFQFPAAHLIKPWAHCLLFVLRLSNEVGIAL